MNSPEHCCEEIKDCKERKCVECEIPAIERNNYFCGKLMVERDFWCDQHYHMGKQRRHNRTAHGWGTVCGLKVVQHLKKECQDKYVVIKPGVAMDCCGREIVVREEMLIPLPKGKSEDEMRKKIVDESIESLRKVAPERTTEEVYEKARLIISRELKAPDMLYKRMEQPARIASLLKNIFHINVLKGFTNKEDERRKTEQKTIYIAIRYRECYTEPVPSLYSECGCDDKCEPNRIKETFEIKVLEESELKDAKSDIDKLISPLNESEPCKNIYKKVVEECPECSDHSKEHWVILAAIKNYIPGDRVINDLRKAEARYRVIDNYTVRKLVPSTDVLYQMIRCLINKEGTPKPETEEKLTHIKKISWEHNESIRVGNFIDRLKNGGIYIKFSDEVSGVDDKTFVMTIRTPIDHMIGNINVAAANVSQQSYRLYHDEYIPGSITPDNDNKFIFKIDNQDTDNFSGYIYKILKYTNKPVLIRVLVKCDFILGENNKKPVAGNHYVTNNLNPDRKSGLKIQDRYFIPGGVFESWFTITKND